MRVPTGRSHSQITGNQARDQPSPGLRLTGRRVNRALRERGWIVLRIWQHELRRRDEATLVRRLRSSLCA